MKKLIATLFAGAALLFGSALMAQDAAVATEAAQTDTTVVAEEQTEESALAVAPAEEKVVRKSFHQALKEKFIQGGAGWMTPIL
ncbi:MAG: MotA/TolQ/ExbB proton channel family protein, partial [Bacteroidales bacterium]|nr:MotA/TolQ/ExbB proton channel family protein [Bacteroidales bacterium]